MIIGTIKDGSSFVSHAIPSTHYAKQMIKITTDSLTKLAFEYDFLGRNVLVNAAMKRKLALRAKFTKMIT